MAIFGYNIQKIRKDFSILDSDLIYFDNACMSLRPTQVIQAQNRYYEQFPGCGGRSSHHISKKVDEEVSKARHIIRKSFNASDDKEIIFTKNTTEGINIVANGLDLKKGDIILCSDKEHNSNLLPWQKLKKEKGIIHTIIPSNEDNTFSLENFKSLLSSKVKLVSLCHTSNLDGTTIPAKEIIKLAHDHGALVLLDGAQSAPFLDINLKKLDVDFFAFSGHKMCGPSGIGVLYGKYHLLEKLQPYTVGGETVYETTYTDAKFEPPPQKFEPGLQHYAGIVGLGAAVQYIDSIGRSNIEKHKVKLNTLLTKGLLKHNRVTLIGPEDPAKRSGIVNILIKDADPHQVAIMLDKSSKICVRSGAHCVHSWFNKHKLSASLRASLYFYNTEEEIQKFLEAFDKVLKLC